MKKPLLSILIPTYNRENTLHPLLEIISKNFYREYNDIVEIIVSDNSDHKLRQINKKNIKSINENLNRSNCRHLITYIENYENIGYGKNLIQLFNLSTGSYFWFISDGDKVNENALFVIIKHIKKYKYEY